MFLVFFIGSTALLISVGSAVAYYRTPTRTFCPTCEAKTSPVQGPVVLRRAPGLSWRWCGACGWQGVGRKGPDWVAGRLMAHDSGFHWGEERFPEDFGFKWRVVSRESERAPEPEHPSGFRFTAPNDSASEPASGDTEDAPPHPSGFRWSGAADPLDEPGFRWRGNGTPSNDSTSSGDD